MKNHIKQNNNDKVLGWVVGVCSETHADRDRTGKQRMLQFFFLRYTVIGTGQPSADTNVQRERTEGRCQGVKRSGIRS